MLKVYVKLKKRYLMKIQIEIILSYNLFFHRDIVFHLLLNVNMFINIIVRNNYFLPYLCSVFVKFVMQLN